LKLTSGLVVKTIYPGLGPIDLSDTQLRLISRKSDALPLLALPLVKAAKGQLVDLAGWFPWPVISNDPTVGYWGIQLLIPGKRKGEEIQVTELVGDLLERAENPRPPDERDPQGNPGRVLKVNFYPNEMGGDDPSAPSGFGQMYWGN
jgi:hypothetical protein